MKQGKIPFEKTIFVCTNVRMDGRVACGNPGRGGEELCHRLKEAVKKAGLKAKIRVARSGCLDLCEKGPNMFVYPDGQWLSNVSPDHISELLNTLKIEKV